MKMMKQGRAPLTERERTMLTIIMALGVLMIVMALAGTLLLAR